MARVRLLFNGKIAEGTCAARNFRLLLLTLLLGSGLVGLAVTVVKNLAYAKRSDITSLAGNPGDLAAFLVLPCLLAQAGIAGAARGGRLWRAAALVVCVYALGQGTLSATPGLVLIPSAFLFATVLSLNLLGDALRARWGVR